MGSWRVRSSSAHSPGKERGSSPPAWHHMASGAPRPGAGMANTASRVTWVLVGSGGGGTKGNSVALRGDACGDFCSQWAAERADSSDGGEEAQTPKAATSELAGGGLCLGPSKGSEHRSAPSRGGSSPRWLWQGWGCCCRSLGRRGLSWPGVTFPAQWLPLCPGVRAEQVLPGHPQPTIRHWLTLNLPRAPVLWEPLWLWGAAAAPLGGGPAGSSGEGSWGRGYLRLQVLPGWARPLSLRRLQCLFKLPPTPTYAPIFARRWVPDPGARPLGWGRELSLHLRS